MCNNHYLLSIQKVFKLFSPDTPKTMERIIQELGDDVFDLTFDGESLYKFVTKMDVDGSLDKTENGYILSKHGQKTLKELNEWVASYDLPRKRA